MDRGIVYPGSIPLDTDVLNAQRNTMIALGYLAQATLGTGTVVDGLTCAQTTVPSLAVTVGPGSILALSTVDATAYGSLAADTADALVKMGINIGSTTLAIAAPTTSGQSINYLIEAAFQESDTSAIVLPYYNAASPSTPYSGPGNAGTAQNTQRLQRVALQAKAGVPATTGTQTTPAADTGYTGLYVVTVAYGATSVINSNISTVSGAPFIGAKVPAIKTLAGSNTTGITNAGTTTLLASQAGLVEVNATAGNITINLPAPNSLGSVFRYEFLRVDASANTVTVVAPSGSIINEPSAASSITLPPSSLTRLICDSSNYIQDGPYSGATSFHNVQTFTSSGTFTVPGTGTVIAEVWGGGSGSAAGYSAGTLASAGGGGGGYSRKVINGLTPGSTVVVTVGAGGASGTTTVLPTAGGSSSFGSYCSATGGGINGALTLTSPINPGFPGSGSSGDLNVEGCWGCAPFSYTAGSTNVGGNGGAAALGGGGGSGNTAAGTMGSFPGGGGGGCGPSTTTGTAGAAGLVIVRY